MGKQFRLLTMVFILAGLMGCSGNKGAERIKRTNDAKEIGLAYHKFLADSNSKPPTQAADLKKYIQDDKAYAWLSSGDFVFFWDVGIANMPDGAGKTILGYEKDAPEKGGIVLFGDAVVKELTADEFKKTTLAKKK